MCYTYMFYNLPPLTVPNHFDSYRYLAWWVVFLPKCNHNKKEPCHRCSWQKKCHETIHFIENVPWKVSILYILVPGPSKGFLKGINLPSFRVFYWHPFGRCWYFLFLTMEKWTSYPSHWHGLRLECWHLGPWECKWCKPGECSNSYGTWSF